MNFDNVKTVPCIGEQPPEVITNTEDTRCLTDLEYAAIMGESVCTNAPSFDGLYIEPALGYLTKYKDQYVKYRAFLQFKYPDTAGTTKKIDVTERASWGIGDKSVAMPQGKGEFYTQAVSATKETKVTATYTPSVVVDGVTKSHDEALKTSAPLKVLVGQCVDTAKDIVLVLDRSGSMLKKDGGEETRAEAARKACREFIKNSRMWRDDEDKNKAATISASTSICSGVEYETDRIAFVSYAGDEGEESVTTVSDFVDTKTAALGVVESNKLKVSEDCKGGTGSETGCWTGMGGGLQRAYDLLKGKDDGGVGMGARVCPDTATATNAMWPRKLIILLTDGHENVCNPDPVDVAGDIKDDRYGESGATNAHDTMIAVVGFMLDSTTTIKRCSSGTPTGSSTTVGDYLKLISNCYGNSSAQATALTFFPDTHTKLIQTYNEALETICTDNMNNDTVTGCHYLDTTGLSAGKQGQIRDQFAFSSFKHWNVCKNSVDLMGKDLWQNAHLTAGMYVSLIGNRGYLPVSDVMQVEYPETDCPCQCHYVPWDHNFGGIETKKSFTFTEKDSDGDQIERRLVLKYGGNMIKGPSDFLYGGVDLSKCGSSIRVTIGGTQLGLGSDGGVGEETRARFANDKGSLIKSANTSLPLLTTRKIKGAFYEEIINVGPRDSLTTLNIPLPYGDGGSYKIRIEQFPDDFKTALKFEYEIPEVERDRIFTEDLNCSNIKGTATNPLTFEDFSGFISDSEALVFGDQNEAERYTTSGADEMLANVPYGVCLAEVTLQEGTTTDGTFTPNATDLFMDDFESETGVN